MKLILADHGFKYSKPMGLRVHAWWCRGRSTTELTVESLEAALATSSVGVAGLDWSRERQPWHFLNCLTQEVPRERVPLMVQTLKRHQAAVNVLDVELRQRRFEIARRFPLLDDRRAALAVLGREANHRKAELLVAAAQAVAALVGR
jgi:hypothetical protein